MMIMKSLLDYTLEIICKGNKSDCARRLGMDYTELRKLRKRMSNGSGSIKLTEAMLEMYMRENVSMDRALSFIAETNPDMSSEIANDFCTSVTVALHAAMNDECRAAQDNARLVRSAQAFMKQIERTFCGEACRQRRGCKDECPCKQFTEFWDWLKSEMRSMSPTQQ